MRSSLRTKVTMGTTFCLKMGKGPHLVFFEQNGPLCDTGVPQQIILSMFFFTMN